jgi:hypothetical protein
MKILRDYIPANPQFFTNEKLNELELPAQLNAKSLAEFKEQLSDFDIIQVEKPTTADRYLDNFEISEIRAAYCQLVEDELPKFEKQLQRITEDSKLAVKEAKELVDATLTTIKDFAAKVANGLVKVELAPEKTFKVPFNRNFYFYSIINNVCKLVKVEPIPDEEMAKWYNANWNAKAINE